MVDHLQSISTRSSLSCYYLFRVNPCLYYLFTDLNELDENIFEYLITLFDQQTLKKYREKIYESMIECDICHRVRKRTQSIVSIDKKQLIFLSV